MMSCRSISSLIGVFVAVVFTIHCTYSASITALDSDENYDYGDYDAIRVGSSQTESPKYESDDTVDRSTTENSAYVSDVAVDRETTEDSEYVSDIAVDREITENPEPSTPEPVQKVNKMADMALGDLLDAGPKATVTLVAGDALLVAHRAVLTARSSVFAQIFQYGKEVVEIPDVELPVLRQLVAYLYTRKAPQLPGMAMQLLVAADRYGVPDLKAECERQMAAQLTVETAAGTAVFAVKHSYDSLQQTAAAFIKAHLVEVLGTQGWADAMRGYTEELIKVSQLLSRGPAGPRLAIIFGGTSVESEITTTIQPTTDSDLTASVYALRGLSAEEKGEMLIKAAKEGSVQDLRVLLAAGADVAMMGEMSSGWDMWTALHWAAWEGSVDAVKYLVEGGAEVEARSKLRYTPLHVAAWLGRLGAVKLLLGYSADPNTSNKWGWTPLHDAARHGREEVAVALLEAGANRWATTDEGKTPLDFARQYNHFRLLNILLSR